MSLTERQSEILAFLREHLRRHGHPPTLREVAGAFAIQPSAVAKHLDALAAAGAIELSPGRARGIRLRDSAALARESMAGTLALPLVGRVAAGAPILAAEHLEGEFHVDRALFRPPPDYLLKVRGDSMQGIGILDGDLVAVRRAPTAEPGQVVVARVDGEVTVKRFRRRGARIELIAENPDYAPIVVDPARQSFAIEGLYVGVIRRAA
jgi:repressor LexA